MDKMTLETMTTHASVMHAAKRTALFAAAELAIEKKQALETSKAQATTGGVFDGKNAETREAQAREHLQAEYGALAEAEKAERRARYEFELAHDDMDTVKTLLRIAELVQ